jgi:hypothetical protein
MTNMKNLVGRSFAIAENRYRIVDVQRLGKEALVYAEPVIAGQHGPARSARTAFHYRDIADFLAIAQGSEAVLPGAS